MYDPSKLMCFRYRDILQYVTVPLNFSESISVPTGNEELYEVKPKLISVSVPSENKK